jgi:transcription initiation factor TFIID subunit 12
MPIPKTLKIDPPKAAVTDSSRPTLLGGLGHAAGDSVHQPALEELPKWDLDPSMPSVLDKKKLDELCRQVVGGGDGNDGNPLLAPDAEEVSVLNLLLLVCILEVPAM